MATAQCDWCGKTFNRASGSINRSKARGDAIYCGRVCSGLGRRTEKTPEQRRAEKAEYDRKRREKLRDRIKAEKAEYHRRTYDPVSAAVKRKERMPRHVEYCRRPEYRAKKKEYDRRHRAEKNYGEFAECFLLSQDIRDECLSRMSDYEIRLQAGTLNKQLQRRRNYERTHGNKPEIGSLGDA